MKVLACVCAHVRQLALLRHSHSGPPIVEGRVRSRGGPTRLVRPDGEVVMPRPLPLCVRRHRWATRHATVPPLVPMPRRSSVPHPPRLVALEPLNLRAFHPEHESPDEPDWLDQMQYRFEHAG